jgi:hypothetical protein
VASKSGPIHKSNIYQGNGLADLKYRMRWELLVASKTTAFGSEATTALIVANQRQAEFDKGLLTERNIELERKIETLRDDLENTRVENSRLMGRIGTQSSLKRARRVLSVVAGLAVAIGLALSQSQNAGLSIAAFAAAIACLLGIWFVEDKDSQ